MVRKKTCNCSHAAVPVPVPVPLLLHALRLYSLPLPFVLPTTHPLYSSPASLPCPRVLLALDPLTVSIHPAYKKSLQRQSFLLYTMLRSCWTIQVMVALGLHCTGAVLQMLFALSSSTQVTAAVHQAAPHTGFRTQSYELFFCSSSLVATMYHD